MDPWGAARAAIGEKLGYAAFLQPMWRAIAAEIAIDEGAVLDLKARSGWICIHVASGRPEVDAIGIERDPHLRARAEANRRGRLNVVFKDLPTDRLTYPDRTFAVAVAVGVVLGPTELGEVWRVLRPGGRLVIYDAVPEWNVPEAWIARTGIWPPAQVIARALRRLSVGDAAWEAQKVAVLASPFRGGAEGTHGCFRTVALLRPVDQAEIAAEIAAMSAGMPS